MIERLCALGEKLLCIISLVLGGIAAIFVFSLFTPFGEFVKHPATAMLLGIVLGFTFAAGVAITNIFMRIVSGAGFLERLCRAWRSG